jgi:hypothetical protein
MPLAVIKVYAPATAHESRHQDRAHIARALALAATAIQGAAGSATAGTILDTGATEVGSWVIEPQASK